MGLSKKPVIIGTSVLGVLYAIMGLILLRSGVESAFNESLKTLEYDNTIAIYNLIVGTVFLFACGLGWIAATSKSPPLNYFYGLISLFIMLLFSTLAIGILVMKANMRQTILDGCMSTQGMYNDLDEIYTTGS